MFEQLSNYLLNSNSPTILVGRKKHTATQKTGRLGSTGYKGVSKVRAKFRVTIYIDGFGCRLGTYTTALEAALAYDKKSRELFGKNALVNFP